MKHLQKWRHAKTRETVGEKTTKQKWTTDAEEKTEIHA